MLNSPKTSSAPHQHIMQLVTDKLVKRKKEVHAFECSLDASSGWSLEYLNGSVKKLEQSSTVNLIIKVYQKGSSGYKKGSCVTNLTSSAALDQAIDQALNSAHYAECDEASGLADHAQLAWNYPNLELDFPIKLTPQEATRAAAAAEKTFLAKDARIKRSSGIEWEAVRAHHYYTNSLGFQGDYASSYALVSGSLIAADAAGNMQRDGDFDVASDASRLRSLDDVMNSALKRTLSRLNAAKLTPRRCPVIFSAEIAPSLLAPFLAAIGGYNIYLGNSFLVDKLDKQVFAPKINLIEQPLLPARLGSAPFDDEGVALRERPLVTDGRLEHYLLSSYSARKLKIATGSTGNAGGVHNLMVQSTTSGGLDALLAKVNRGLLVTELYSGNENILNGDYSCGAFGYWVENGKIQYPVKELTIAGNLKDMLLNIAMAGDDVDYRHNVCSGSLVVSEMTVASN